MLSFHNKDDRFPVEVEKAQKGQGTERWIQEHS